MKAGARAVGVAESYDGDSGGDARSTLAAAVVRADRVVDGLAFGGCTVGGTDATGAVVDLVCGLDREDLSYAFVSGIAPAWYNVLDLGTIADAAGLPVVSVSFEGSPGLEPALREAFEREALEARLATYRAQPDRTRLVVGGRPRFVRAVGVGPEQAREAVRSFTPEGGRPEPLRVARLAARGADRWRAVS